MCVTWLITLGWGQNRPWVLGTLMYDGVKLEREGKIGLKPVLNIHTHFSHTHPIFFFLFTPLQLSRHSLIMHEN